ncbi:MAG: ion transporter [Acidimicrobiales bacterium]
MVVTDVKAGTPRSEADVQALDRFHTRIQIPIVLAALLPLIIVPESGGWVAELVGVIAWVVFVVDFVVSERRLTRYLGTWLGRFDLTVVVLTAPWYLLPGMHEGRFVVILRLARLARVVMASRGARRLMERLGRVGLVALGVLVIASAVAYHAEHATNPEFANYGDSLWWGIVTMTTVGYGDIVPKTSVGRWAAVMIMLTGVAVIGVLAGSLASFFRLEPADQEEELTAEAGTPSDGMAPAVTPTPEFIFARMDELRSEMERLMALLPSQSLDQPGDSS